VAAWQNKVSGGISGREEKSLRAEKSRIGFENRQTAGRKIAQPPHETPLSAQAEPPGARGAASSRPARFPQKN